MIGNDTITTTRVNLRGERGANPYARNTPEWAAWQAGFAAGQSKPRNMFGSIR